MKVKFITLLCFSLFVFSCNKSDDSVEPVDPVQQDPPKEPTAVVPLKGKFIDSEVQGLSYSTATQSGITNESGEFEYVEGEEITFKVGNVVLGKAAGQAEITPITLAQETDANATIASKEAQNIAAFLQTLDTDGDESNGITISEETATNLGVSAVDFSLPVESVLADIILSVVQNAKVELKLVYPSDAANNMANSLGIDYQAPENLSLTHLIPALKTFFQTSDRSLTSTTAVYKNTFDPEGNLMSIDILSRYSSKQFFKLNFTAHNSKGLPEAGTLTTYRANSLYGGFSNLNEFTNIISLSYNQDDQLNIFSELNDDGTNLRTEQFISYNENNRPLSLLRDLGADNPDRDFTISWNFTYENGLIATADRIYDEVWVIDENTTYVTYTTRDFNYGYNEVNNLKSLNYTRVFTDNSTFNGETQSSSTEASVSETFNYDGSQKLTSHVINEEIMPSSGDPYSATSTRNYDANELLASIETSSTNGRESSINYEQGIIKSSEEYRDGLLSYEAAYNDDGSSVNTSYYYDDNGVITFKEISEYGLDGILSRTYEYYTNGVLDFTQIEEYSANVRVKSTGYNADGSIAYIDYFNETGFATRSDIYFEGEFNYYITYEYDNNGFRIKSTSIYPDGEVFGVRDFTYNSLGLTDTITYSSPDEGIYLTDVFEYDENNFVSSISGFGANGNISYKLFYEEGVLVREEIYDENGELVDVFDYTTTGKRVISFNNLKEDNSNVKNQIQNSRLNLDLDRRQVVPQERLNSKKVQTKKSYNSMIEHRVSNKIQKIRIGQRN